MINTITPTEHEINKLKNSGNKLLKIPDKKLTNARLGMLTNNNLKVKFFRLILHTYF